jgi:FRG domain
LETGLKQLEIQLATILSSGLTDPINPDAKKIVGIEGVDKGTYFEYAFSEGAEILAAIDFQSELYSSKYHNVKREFLFRGQQDATWPLRPSVYRPPDCIAARDVHKRDIVGHYHGAQIDYEIEPFVRFLEEVNNLGFMIEGESIELIEYARAKKKFLQGCWPSDQFNNSERKFPTRNQMRTLALAQHYGLPTRLLDWTTNPYNAAFFAVSSISGLRAESKRIGLWVIPTLLLEAVRAIKFLEFVEVPKFQNANIVAQQGVFTSYVPPLEQQHFTSVPFPLNSTKDSVITFDAYLCEAGGNGHLEDIIAKVTGKPMLFTLPHDNVGAVHEKLEQLNISWTTMMPNLEGATKEALRKRRFSK